MEKIYEYWLCSIPGVGNRSIDTLLNALGNAEQIYRAGTEQLSKLLKSNQLEELKRLRSQWNLQEEFDKLTKLGIGFLTKEESEYPWRLKKIPDAPYAIFYKGKLPENDCLSVAIIGARDCSEYGAYVARELGRFLGEKGVQVISGMARGIDGISQEAVLAAGGATTAVLGSGVDVCYPRQNRALYGKILEQGCILSAYTPGTLPKPQNFPPRNRIVSGLADVVVVIEARNKSGTLVTVDMALEQGKEVYVVPGRITDRLSDGCNRLLKQGAGILLSPTEFMEEIQEMWQRQESVPGQGRSLTLESGNKKIRIDRKKTECMEKRKVDNLPQDLQRIYDLLDYTPQSTGRIWDRLSETLSLSGPFSISELNVGLMRLCMMGVVFQESPGYFYRN